LARYCGSFGKSSLPATKHHDEEKKNQKKPKKPYDDVEITMGKTKSHVYHSTLPASKNTHTHTHTHIYLYFQKLINLEFFIKKILLKIKYFPSQNFFLNLQKKKPPIISEIFQHFWK
jgi:hypothetical protein